jgi:hypothetical protein
MDSRIFKNKRSMISGLLMLGALIYCISAPAQRLPRRNPPVRSPSQQPEPGPAVLDMRVEEGKVAAEIINCPMQTVLKELADWTGIQFEVRSNDNPPVSVRLYGVSVQEAIQRIASDDDTVFTYVGGKPGAEDISFVRVFPRTKPVQQPGIIYLGTGVVTKKPSEPEEK